MNKDLVKLKLKDYIDKKIRVKVYLGRNKYEYFDGYIDKMHPNIFTLITDIGTKSFSYTDVLVKNVMISKIS